MLGSFFKELDTPFSSAVEAEVVHARPKSHQSRDVAVDRVNEADQEVGGRGMENSVEKIVGRVRKQEDWLRAQGD
ncbi:MAG: hypothetical protein SGI92_22745 [Bryobacteraceae bacterium]|nr:hypothetical protein [Bryobacteraceae bacterium]